MSTSAQPALHPDISGQREPATIELSHVTRSFVTSGRKKRSVTTVTALADISLDVPQGQFLAVVGPSGCGKSTLLTLVSGLAAPDAGTVRVLGKSVTSIQRDVGFIFQRDALLPWRTALENVVLPLRFRGKRKADATAIAREWLAKVGLARFASSYPHQLSGGMRKRVSIAATMAYEPPILLMDEPFSALDVETRIIMESDLMRLWELNKPTVLFITHDLQEAVSLGDRVVVLSAGPGQVIADYPIDLPRPRDLIELRYDEHAIALQQQLWEHLRVEVLKSNNS